MKKITKKEYEKLINCEHYYVTPFIGTFEDLNDFLSKEKSAEIIKDECQKFTGIFDYDYKTYIHIISDFEWKEEHKKGGRGGLVHEKPEDMTDEEWEKIKAEHEARHEKPEGMTDEEWEQKKAERKARHEKPENMTDEEWEQKKAEREAKMKEKLEADKESAFISKEIATIYRDVPLEVSLDDVIYHGPDFVLLNKLYENFLQFMLI